MELIVLLFPGKLFVLSGVTPEPDFNAAYITDVTGVHPARPWPLV